MLIDCAFVTVRMVTKAAFPARACDLQGSCVLGGWLLVGSRHSSLGESAGPYERPEAKPAGNERPGSRRPGFPASRWSGARASSLAV